MKITLKQLKHIIREEYREFPSMDAGGPADLGDWVKEYPEDDGAPVPESDDVQLEDLTPDERSELAWSIGYDRDEPMSEDEWLESHVDYIETQRHQESDEYGGTEWATYWFVTDNATGDEYISVNDGDTWQRI